MTEELRQDSDPGGPAPGFNSLNHLILQHHFLLDFTLESHAFFKETTSTELTFNF